MASPQAQPKTVPHPTIPGLVVNPRDLDVMAEFRDRDTLPEDITMPRNVVTICSVVPWPLVTQKYHQLRGMPVFAIPSAFDPKVPSDFPSKPDPLDQPGHRGFRLLRLRNTTSQIMDVNGDPQTKPGYIAKERYAIDPNDPTPTNGYAFDIINEWAGGRPRGEGGKLGVAIISGQKPWARDNVPTDAELSMLHRLQHNFFKHLIRRADTAYVSQDKRNPPAWFECRRALEYANQLYDEPIERHPWYIGLGEIVALTNCPACAMKFNSAAFICKECHTNLCEYFADRGIEFDPKKYPGVAQEMEFRKRKQSKAG
jgi:hypothetical protein